jgi:type IV pilus assembly protein PilA
MGGAVVALLRMNLMRPILGFVLLAFGSACGGGGGQPAAAPSTAAATATAAPEATAPAPPLHPEAALALRLDVARLQETPLYQGVLSAFGLTPFAKHLEAANKTCGFSIPDALSAVALSVTIDESTVVAVTTTKSHPPETVLGCVRALAGRSESKLDDGTPAVKLGGDGFAAVKDGILYVGQSSAILRTAAGGGSTTALARRVTLSGDTVMAFACERFPGPVSSFRFFAGTLRASDKEFWLDGEIDTGSESAAAEMAKFFRRFDTPIKGLGPVATLNADGKVLRVHLGVEGDGNEQAHMVGQLASVAIYGLRRYIAEAKTAEATSAVPEIARDLASSVERAKPAHGPARFPVSAPAVPADVPKGAKYQSTESDWMATWKEIGFSLKEPQYFRYSIVTAADRKHAIVRAEGDLDGDGKTSLYEIPMEINGKGEVTQSAMKVVPEPEP